MFCLNFLSISPHLINALLHFGLLSFSTGKNQICSKDSNKLQFLMKTICLFLNSLHINEQNISQNRSRTELPKLWKCNYSSINSRCWTESVKFIKTFIAIISLIYTVMFQTLVIFHIYVHIYELHRTMYMKQSEKGIMSLNNLPKVHPSCSQDYNL